MGKRNNAGGNGEQGPSAPSKVLRSTPSSSLEDFTRNLNIVIKERLDVRLKEMKKIIVDKNAVINLEEESKSLKEENESLKQEINMLKQNQADSKPNKEQSCNVM